MSVTCGKTPSFVVPLTVSCHAFNSNLLHQRKSSPRATSPASSFPNGFEQLEGIYYGIPNTAGKYGGNSTTSMEWVSHPHPRGVPGNTKRAVSFILFYCDRVLTVSRVATAITRTHRQRGTCETRPPVKEHGEQKQEEGEEEKKTHTTTAIPKA